jgi:hypothetical protein
VPTSVSTSVPTSALVCVSDIWLDIGAYKRCDVDIEKHPDICTDNRTDFSTNKLIDISAGMRARHLA